MDTARQKLTSPAIERQVIAAVLTDGYIESIARRLPPDAFYVRSLAHAWTIMLDMQESGTQITPDLVELHAKERRLDVSAAELVKILLDEAMYAPSLALEENVRVLIDLYERRKLIAGAERIAAAALDMSKSVFDARQEVTEMAAEQVNGISRVIDASDAAIALYAEINETRASSIPTQLPDLDEAIGGFPLHHLTVLAGDSGLGKTAILLQLAELMSIAGNRVLYVTTESKGKTLVARRVFGTLRLPLKYLRNKSKLAPEMTEKIEQLASDYMNIHSGSLVFDETTYNLRDLEASINDVKPDVVIVDHVRELDLDAAKYGGETLALLQGYKALKRMAKQYDCAVVAIHTVNDDGARDNVDGSRPPSNSVLGWAKDLRYIADILMYLTETASVTGLSNVRGVNLWVKKDREGARDYPIGLRYDVLSQWYYDTKLHNIYPNKSYLVIGATDNSPQGANKDN